MTRTNAVMNLNEHVETLVPATFLITEFRNTVLSLTRKTIATMRAEPVNGRVNDGKRTVVRETLKHPEVRDRYRREKEILSNFINHRPVTCEERDRDRYGRIVAVCYAGGEDLNAWMVLQGLAVAYRRYSLGYVDQEADARLARRGIWATRFVLPWEWRRGKRLSQGAANENQPCRIKGNISRGGEWIYHVPGGRWYDRTKISPSKGERWFCSEEEAQAAGWRRARQ